MAESTREKLLDGARRCLLDRGHAGASVKAIAQAAGVNHGLVHHYFGSKEQLFVAVIHREAERMDPRQLNISDPEELREVLMRSVFPNSETVRLIVEIVTLAGRMPALAEEVRAIWRNRRQFLTSVTGIGDRILLTQITATVMGLAMQYNLEPSTPVREVMGNLFRQLSPEMMAAARRSDPQPKATPEKQPEKS